MPLVSRFWVRSGRRTPPDWRCRPATRDTAVLPGCNELAPRAQDRGASDTIRAKGCRFDTGVESGRGDRAGRTAQPFLSAGAEHVHRCHRLAGAPAPDGARRLRTGAGPLELGLRRGLLPDRAHPRRLPLPGCPAPPERVEMGAVNPFQADPAPWPRGCDAAGLRWPASADSRAAVTRGAQGGRGPLAAGPGAGRYLARPPLGACRVRSTGG